ncbi:MAG: MarR family winged helix-turn-helix transcriptional regulator [Desulfotomaculales bacterium]
MSEELRDKARRIRDLLHGVTRNLRRYIFSEIAGCGLTVPQLFLVQELQTRPGLTLTELSERLGLSKSTVSGMVDRLLRRGVITRRRSETDRRVAHLYLAPCLLEQASRLTVLKENYLARLLNRLEPGEVDEIIAALEKLELLVDAAWPGLPPEDPSTARDARPGTGMEGGREEAAT